jgi:copper(I)-binding protein
VTIINKQAFVGIVMASLIIPQFCFADTQPHGHHNVHINNAWSPAAPPVAPTRVGYFSIVNVSDKTIVIVDITSPLFAQANFHETRIADGVVSMTVLGKLVLKRKQELIFEPGGMHLMLMNAKDGLVKAKSIPLMLGLDDGQKIHLELIVKTTETIATPTMKSMDHSAHAHH